MVNSTYIALLTAFGGIGLGFLLGQLGAYLQATREDKRVLKQVLFNQLDIWVEMKRADVDSIVPLLVDKFQQALLRRGAQQDQLDAMFAVSFAPLIELFRALKLADPDRLKERYEQSVNQLAKVDPLLAYQLTGRPQTDLNERVDTFIDRVVELEGKKAHARTSSDAVAFFSGFIKGYGYDRMLSNMEHDIVDVARKIGYLTAYRTRRVIQQLTMKLADEAESYIDKLLDSIVTHVAAQTPTAPLPTDEAKAFGSAA